VEEAARGVFKVQPGNASKERTFLYTTPIELIFFDRYRDPRFPRRAAICPVKVNGEANGEPTARRVSPASKSAALELISDYHVDVTKRRSTVTAHLSNHSRHFRTSKFPVKNSKRFARFVPSKFLLHDILDKIINPNSISRNP